MPSFNLFSHSSNRPQSPYPFRKEGRKEWRKDGLPWISLSVAMVSVCLLLVLGLFLLIGIKGLHHFWPAPLEQWTLQNHTIIGQVFSNDAHQLNENHADVNRLTIKIANRDRHPHDFISVLETDLPPATRPENLAVIERITDGQFFGIPVGFIDSNPEAKRQGKHFISDVSIEQILSLLDNAHQLRDEVTDIQARLRQLMKQKNPPQAQINQAQARIAQINQTLGNQSLKVQDMAGVQVVLPMSSILDVWYPNQMNTWDKLRHWGKQVGKFFIESPRESNSEGGVLPAIFGTVLLVILMAIVVMPLGVMVAVYLYAYAGKNALTKLIQIAVVNLAGVPSIVYGVFGLGFFVYSVGGSLDALLVDSPESAPIWGTPGLLWSALTLALLTLPVVIVATQEGLARVPDSIRHASYALGATKFETLTRITLPLVSPAIMTGLILAVARAAGEVAPLMLVGVVKYTSNLPLDGDFPYLHLDRQFMHLGFHIYDVGFQTTHIEAARPLVYATALLLILVVAGLNLTAMAIRHNLRNKFQLLGSDQ